MKNLPIGIQDLPDFPIRNFIYVDKTELIHIETIYQIKKMTYQINTDKILYSQVGDDGVVYDLESNEYVTLNETFYKILQGIEAGKGKPEIIRDLRVEYDISEAGCAASVDKAIAELVQKGFIK